MFNGRFMFGCLRQFSLVNALSKELKEATRRVEFSNWAEEFLQENGYSVEDSPNTRYLVFKRSAGFREIEISVDVSDIDTAENRMLFEVLVRKTGAPKVVAFNCLCTYTDIEINEFIVKKDLVNLHVPLVPGYRNNVFLTFPPDTFPDEIKESLGEYLANIGINEDLIKLMLQFSVEKSNRLFTEFLNTFINIVK